MHVYRPTPTPGRPTSLSYVKKPTTLSSIVVADYSEGRLQISPDLSRVASPTDNKLFDSFGLVNPLSKIGSRGEDYYWEVTLLTNGLCQIGVACLSPEYRHLQFSPNPRGGAGVGDVSCSVGIDLSRSVCFLSGLGGRTKIALPYKWCDQALNSFCNKRNSTLMLSAKGNLVIRFRFIAGILVPMVAQTCKCSSRPVQPPFSSP